MVISVEDIGFGEPQAPMMIHALYQMLCTFDRSLGERKLFAIHAVRYLCQCPKDRTSDEMIVWVKLASQYQGILPKIPDYALDMHTAEGQKMGRDFHHFLEVGAKLDPEMSGRDPKYRQRILGILAEMEK
jgi:replication-associated recombination protein RarA